jgi:phosphoribosylaminoimidazole-succinocarboxamide synthase
MDIIDKACWPTKARKILLKHLDAAGTEERVAEIRKLITRVYRLRFKYAGDTDQEINDLKKQFELLEIPAP